MSNGTTERRSHARFERTFEVRHLAPTEGEVARMIACNLSMGGLYCTSTRNFDEMTRLAVRLMLPIDGEAEPVDVEAVVVRNSEVEPGNGGSRYELALFFTKIDDEPRERLSRYLAR